MQTKSPAARFTLNLVFLFKFFFKFYRQKMKVFVVLSVLFVAGVAAKPSVFLAPTFYAAPAPIVSQYHSQDELGQYAYGYSGGLSAKVESKTFDGVTRGSYSYVDAEGHLQTVQYTADALNGFRAAATNLPKAPVDNGVAPEPVQDTPEVAKAKEEHAAAFNEAAVRAAAEPEQPAPEAEIRSVAPVAPIAPYAPIVAYQTAELPARFSYSYQQAPAGYAYYPSVHYSAPILAHPASYAAVHQLPAIADTPEVAKAKAEHFAAVEEQKAKIAAAY